MKTLIFLFSVALIPWYWFNTYLQKFRSAPSVILNEVKNPENLVTYYELVI
jgi:hypothetical protein